MSRLWCRAHGRLESNTKGELILEAGRTVGQSHQGGARGCTLLKGRVPCAGQGTKAGPGSPRLREKAGDQKTCVPEGLCSQHCTDSSPWRGKAGQTVGNKKCSCTAAFVREHWDFLSSVLIGRVVFGKGWSSLCVQEALEEQE